ncbi:MAG: protein kinase [archaeon]|nr:protein kinase [archaeon]
MAAFKKFFGGTPETPSSTLLDEPLRKLFFNDPSLINLDLRFKKLNEWDASRLADALRGNSTLTALNLNGNDLSDVGTARLAAALKTNTALARLDLQENSINLEGATRLAEALRVNSSLTALDLRANSVKNEGAAVLAEALQANATLTALHLDLNGVTDQILMRRIHDKLAQNELAPKRPRILHPAPGLPSPPAVRQPSSPSSRPGSANLTLPPGLMPTPATSSTSPMVTSPSTPPPSAPGSPARMRAEWEASQRDATRSSSGSPARMRDASQGGGQVTRAAIESTARMRVEREASQRETSQREASQRKSEKSMSAIHPSPSRPSGPPPAHLRDERDARLTRAGSGGKIQLNLEHDLTQQQEQQLLAEQKFRLRVEQEARLKAERGSQVKAAREAQLNAEREASQRDAEAQIHARLQAEREAAQTAAERAAQREAQWHIEREAAAKLRAELGAMKAEQERAARLASAEAEKSAQLRAELDALKAKQSDVPVPRSTDFLSRLLITTLDELEIEQDHFAEGANGRLHRGRYHGKQVAVKHLKLSADPRQPHYVSLPVLVKELKMWSLLTHPNIVQLLGYTEAPLPPMIVMELMDGSLYELLHDAGSSLSLLRRVGIAHELASGVSYLHHHQGVHRDIKSLNVLVKGNDVKLADFGGTRSLASLLTVTTGGSTRWNAPEVIKGETPSQASDVYAMGITFSEILTREVPYDHLKVDGAVLFAVVTGTRPQLWPPTSGMQELLIAGEGGLEKETEGFRQLIQKCWQEAPEKRPTAKEVRIELAELLIHLRNLFGPPPPPLSFSSSSTHRLPVYTDYSNT